MMRGKKNLEKTTKKKGGTGIYSRQGPGTLPPQSPVEGQGKRRKQRAHLEEPNWNARRDIGRGAGAKGIPQDPGRVPSSNVDRRERRGGDDVETQGALREQKVSKGERR
jgi:hypothetical protein